MQNFKTSLALDKLPGAVRTTIDGVQGTFIPDEQCDICVTKKGHAYLTLLHWQSATPGKYPSSHYVRPGFSQEYTARYPNAKAPVVGNSKIIQGKLLFGLSAEPYGQIDPLANRTNNQ